MVAEVLLPWERGRAGIGFVFRKGDDRIPVGRDATGRCSTRRDVFPAVRGRPLLPTDGRGPSLTLGMVGVPARSRSWNVGLADCVDMRDCDDG